MACIKRTKYGYRADWRDKQGNRYRQTFELKKDAENFLATVKVDIKDGRFITAKTAPLFREVADQWFDAKNTRCTGGHLSPQTVNKLLTTLTMIFEFARKRKKCVDNVALDADRVKCGNGEITADAIGTSTRRDTDEVSEDEVLSPDELLRLIEHADAGYYRTLFMLAAFTGARHDELLALQWPDIDFDGGQLAIQRSLSWARLPGEDVRPRFFPPKTKHGNRQLKLAPELVHELKVWKLACPPSPLHLVFPTAQGQPMRRDIVLRKGLYPTLKRAKLRRVDMHSLRHSFASSLIAQGASVTEVQSYLGHSTPVITLKVYSRWFKQVKTDSIQRFTQSVLAGNWTPNGHQKLNDPTLSAVSG